MPVLLISIGAQTLAQLIAVPFLHACITYMSIDQVRRSQVPAYSPGGIPTASGWYYPGPQGSAAAELTAAQVRGQPRAALALASRRHFTSARSVYPFGSVRPVNTSSRAAWKGSLSARSALIGR